MTVASFAATQRTDHRVPHAVACRALDVPESTFSKWLDKPPKVTELRRVDIDARVKESFDDSGGTYGSPRVLADLVDEGMTVTNKTVEASMVRQGFWGREPKRHKKGRCTFRHVRTCSLSACWDSRSQMTTPTLNTRRLRPTYQ